MHISKNFVRYPTLCYCYEEFYYTTNKLTKLLLFYYYSIMYNISNLVNALVRDLLP